MEEDALQRVDRKLSAIMALMVEARALRADAELEKTELLLARCGLTAPEISEIVGKSTEAVRKAVQRGRKSNPKS
jgi:DNA-directed RNA polymerase specialized sigma24 family protein